MAESGNSLGKLAVIAPIVIVVIWLLLAFFGSEPPPGNSLGNMLVRGDIGEAHDAELRGDQDTAEWWYRQAKEDADKK